MFSWAPLSSRMLSSAQETNRCAISLATDLLHVALYEKTSKKQLKCYFDYVNLSWAIDSSWEHSTSVKAFCIPLPSSLVLKGTLNVPLIFLQISPKLQVWKTYQET
jgi:hypothetical protein